MHETELTIHNENQYIVKIFAELIVHFLNWLAKAILTF